MVVTVLVVVVTINAVNFIDGLDGLAAGIVGIGAAAFFAYYYTLLHRLGLADQTDPALTSAVLTGLCLGFLPHNFHPARIFMGDTGSMLLGLLLAYAPIASLANINPGALSSNAAYAAGTANRFGAYVPLLVPAAILLIPYADLLLAVLRRTRAGMSPFAPDKKHLQHRLLEVGHSHRASVLIMYLWAGLFAGSVVWLSILQTPLWVLSGVTVAMFALADAVHAEAAAVVAYQQRGQPGSAPRAAVVAAPAVPVGAARAAAVPVVTAPGAENHAGRPAGGVPPPSRSGRGPGESAAAGRRAGMAPARTGPGRGQAGAAASPDEAGWPPAGRANGAAGNGAAGNGATGNGARATGTERRHRQRHRGRRGSRETGGAGVVPGW